MEQARHIVDAAQRLLATQGGFTTQELAKEADVALQTFYRYFGSKDELLLAVFEESIAEGCELMRERAAALTDPIDRLHFFITGAVKEGDLPDGDIAAMERHMTSEHYRLHQLFPEELARASQPFTDMLVPEIEAAAAAGLLAPADVERDAWFVNQLVTATFHHRAFAPDDGSPASDPEALWAFCVRALGGASCVTEQAAQRLARRAAR